MNSWWMLSPGPKRGLISTIKKKISTFIKLVIEFNFIKIIQTIFWYIRALINKTGIFQIFDLPVNILTYYNIIEKKYSIGGKVESAPDERKNFFSELIIEFKTQLSSVINSNLDFVTEKNINFYKNKLLNCKLYLEWGSGSSTLFADKNNINYYSIESDKNFYKYLKKNLKGGNYILKNFGIVRSSSQPVLFTYTKFFYKKRAKAYAEDILNHFREKDLIPDLILIDGRYRILCALNVYKFLKVKNSTSTIIIDDYSARPYLHIIEKFFYGKIVGRFGIFDKLKEFDGIEELIKIYSYDFR